ncbi:unnamed protein product [Didymodactylos carnosus]|uniref:Uncharacterized protein n=1 Tax=Didymodactylos carnosus TaxID=1234261 RepID=A0A815UAZ1_9BILA|nr:unnamed protein product [Didymodactylos carnosus]CAF4374599.1 unnamed protein product [Didymodactylos carnosus]
MESTLPSRRCEVTLNELVYLISQVGRSDLYHEIVLYMKKQQQQTSPTIPIKHQFHPIKNENIICSESNESFSQLLSQTLDINDSDETFIVQDFSKQSLSQALGSLLTDSIAKNRNINEDSLTTANDCTELISLNYDKPLFSFNAADEKLNKKNR